MNLHQRSHKTLDFLRLIFVYVIGAALVISAIKVVAHVSAHKMFKIALVGLPIWAILALIAILTQYAKIQHIIDKVNQASLISVIQPQRAIGYIDALFMGLALGFVFKRDYIKEIHGRSFYLIAALVIILLAIQINLLFIAIEYQKVKTIISAYALKLAGFAIGLGAMYIVHTQIGMPSDYRNYLVTLLVIYLIVRYLLSRIPERMEK
ncbi:MAG: hypothetical protein LBN08_01175 [Lactobacillales bacterium]|jgi:hypothetical protein|nr:hypothetical protein [Lactobacillales bacterium]